MSNFNFYMHQLQFVINPDMTEGLEGCRVRCFSKFHQPVVNQDMHRIKCINVKLPFPHVSTTIYCQLWPKRRVRRVSCHPFCLFHHCVTQCTHFWTEVSSYLSTKIRKEQNASMSNFLFYMCQLQSAVTSDLKEGLEGCPVLCFDLFLPLCGPISPLLNWSLQPVVNQDLHRIKLLTTTICCHLWSERRVRRVSCPVF